MPLINFWSKNISYIYKYILFIIFVFILEHKWLFGDMNFVFRFFFLNWKTNGCLAWVQTFLRLFFIENND